MRCEGCGKRIWFWQFKSFGYELGGAIHSDYFGGGECRRLAWEKHLVLNPELSNPISANDF